MRVITPQMIEAAAKAAHEANLTYCQSIGDTSQVPWDAAPEWQKDSAMKGVLFLLEHPDAGDSAQHDSWMAAKLADGWVYGEVKDAEKKTHPCLVPFDQLPPEQQAKDKLFRETVLSVLNAPVPQPGGGMLLSREGLPRTEAKVLPPEGRPKTPPAQTGDPVVEVAKPEAKPVLQSLEQGKADLDANPGRASVLTDQGHLTR